MTNPPTLRSARTTHHHSALTCDGPPSVTTVPRGPQEAFRHHPCPMRRQFWKSTSQPFPNPSLRRCRLAKGCMPTVASTESNNHSFHQIGARTRMFLVRAHPPSLPKVRSVATVAQHPKCTTTAAIAPMEDHIAVWWMRAPNRMPSQP